MAGSDNPQCRETEARSGRDKEAEAEPGLLVSLPHHGRESQLLIRDLRNLSAKGLWPLGPYPPCSPPQGILGAASQAEPTPPPAASPCFLLLQSDHMNKSFLGRNLMVAVLFTSSHRKNNRLYSIEDWCIGLSRALAGVGRQAGGHKVRGPNTQCHIGSPYLILITLLPPAGLAHSQLKGP